jgi:hypothetical protein
VDDSLKKYYAWILNVWGLGFTVWLEHKNFIETTHFHRKKNQKHEKKYYISKGFYTLPVRPQTTVP